MKIEADYLVPGSGIAGLFFNRAEILYNGARSIGERFGATTSDSSGTLPGP